MIANLAAPAATTPLTSGRFFTDKDYDFVARCAIGHAAQGMIDIGQVLATLGRIQDGNADSWYAAWRATADKIHALATASLVAGHKYSAKIHFLAAAEAYDQALAFFDGMSDKSLFAPTFALHRQCWEAFVDASAPTIERIAIPYEETTLPGYLLRPSLSSTPKPTLVVTNGSDGSIVGLWATGVAGALARGWNAFVYDGPGQQSMLFDRGIYFRPDWEAVLTPVVDTLVTLPAVDSNALFAYGISQAGYWVARALAFEHRFVAAAVDPGVVDVSTSWLGNLPQEMIDILKSGNKDLFNSLMAQVEANPKLAQTLAFRSRPYGKDNPYDTYTAVLEYNLHDLLAQIKTPLLILDPDNESFWPGQPEQLYQQLSCERELAHFPTEDGTDYHCEPMGRMSAEIAIFDFFQKYLNNVGK